MSGVVLALCTETQITSLSNCIMVMADAVDASGTAGQSLID